MKGIERTPLLLLCTFYKQRVLMALQHVQTISILRRAVALGEGSSRLGFHSGGSPPFLI
jgi:hypothetical protein